MLSALSIPLLNRLLTPEDWARNRLRAYAGQSFRLKVGDRNMLRVTVTADGFFASGDPTSEETVVVRLPDDAVARWFIDRAALISVATISGSADFAETLAFVFRNLRWDLTHDLAQLVGDVFARRATQLVTQLARFHMQSAKRLARNVTEFLTEEQTGIASHRDLDRHFQEIDTLRDDVARLQKRIEHYERLAISQQAVAKQSANRLEK